MKKFLQSGVSAGVIIGTSLLLSACSSSATRFDYPTMGYNNDQNVSNYGGDYSRGAGSPSPSPASSGSRDRSSGSSGPGIADGYDSYKPGQQSYRNPGDSGPDRVASYGRSAVESESVRDISQPRRLSRSGNRRPSAPRPVVKSYGNRAGGNTVTVREGDTLYSISRRYGLTADDFTAANNLDSYNIRTGQVLAVPSGSRKVASAAPARSYDSTSGGARKFSYASDRKRAPANSHRVESGETLYSVARKYGISFAKLARWNGLAEDSGLRIGQTLDLKPGQNGRDQDNRRIAALKDGSANKKPDVNSGGGLWVADRPARAVPVREPRIVVAKPVRIPSARKATRPVRKEIRTARVAPSRSAPRRIKRKKAARQRKGGFRWPVRGRIITGFGPMANGKNNDGVNLAVPMGTEVKAADNGIVAYAGNELKGYGNLVLIRHANNFVSAYAHNSKLKVRRGDRIKRGQTVALVGKTGDVNQPQLHFELRKGAKPIDPMSYMSTR